MNGDSGPAAGVGVSPIDGRMGVRSGRGVRAGSLGVTVGVDQTTVGAGVKTDSGSSSPPPARPTDTSAAGAETGISVGTTGSGEGVLPATGSSGVGVTSGVGVVTIGVSGGGRRGVEGTGIVVGSAVAPGGATPAGIRVGHGVGAASVTAGVAVGALITTSPGGT